MQTNQVITYWEFLVFMYWGVEYLDMGHREGGTSVQKQLHSSLISPSIWSIFFLLTGSATPSVPLGFYPHSPAYCLGSLMARFWVFVSRAPEGFGLRITKNLCLSYVLSFNVLCSKGKCQCLREDSSGHPALNSLPFPLQSGSPVTKT